MTDDYSHPGHADMEWIERESLHGRVTIEGWKCTRCNVIAEPDRADEVFDNHDCDQYAKLTDDLSGGMNEALSR